LIGAALKKAVHRFERLRLALSRSVARIKCKNERRGIIVGSSRQLIGRAR